jgi:O-antigen/teichoic acid export membrane protein
MSAATSARALVERTFGRSGPLVLSRLLCTALTFGLPLLLVRLLRPAEFGAYKQFFLVAQTTLLIGQLGLTQSLFYFLPRRERGRGAYLVAAMAFLAALGLLCAAALYLGAPLLGRWLGSPSLVTLRLPLAVTAGAMLAAAPLEGSLLSEGRLHKAALAQVLTDGARAGGMVLLTMLLGSAWLFWAPALVALLRAAALWGLLARGALPAARPSRDRLRAQLGFALPFAAASLLFVAQRTFAQYAVSASFDPATFALFAVACFHLPVVDVVYTPMSEVLMVELARDPAAGLRHFRQATERLAQLLFPAAAGAWLIGPSLLPLLFTSKYAGAVPLFALATAEIPLWCLPLDAVLRAAGDTRFLLALNAARLPLTAACVLGGIRWHGLLGAIAGGLVSEALSRAALLLRARRALGAGVRQLLGGRQLGRIAAAAALAALPALGARLLWPRGPLLVLAPALVYCATYFALLKLLPRPAPSARAEPLAAAA